MTKKLIFSGITLLSGVAFNEAQAQQYKEVGPISYAVPFLTIAPDARSGAMGDAGVALSPDANSQHYNVAKLAMSEDNGGIGLTYSPWLKDIVPDVALIYASGFYKFGAKKDQAISASLRYFNLGEINYRSENNTDNGIGKPYELAFDVGYSRKLSENLSLGANLRYINSNIAPGSSGSGAGYAPASTFAADLGMFYTKTKMITEETGSTFNFGAIVRNVGGRVTYSQAVRDFLPAQLAVGVAYTYKIDKFNKITGTIDLTKLLVPAAKRVITGGDTTYQAPREDYTVVSGLLNSFQRAPGMYGTTIGVGGEYWYQDQFAVRAGYFYEAPKLGNRQFFAAGIGVRYSMFGIDVSYLIPSGSGIARNPLSNTLRFTLLFNFNDKFSKEKDNSES
ncbi:hypothetical protein DBR32_08285 [Taibaiella sp. KBW10]|uniref:type IX secretion system outer membrane channel protein PorV n=1 Tax=Taibaiella sp. KBW10 TaxID=2153357 RepID=UPI000F59D9BF|nr:type IX secretion system outer membrane channel protein PorV [Taibaiella sp. KBW10]RQO30718.1 hypothetical protein DBR32_08285 [Taibaiella sp. KBW10]